MAKYLMHILVYLFYFYLAFIEISFFYFKTIKKDIRDTIKAVTVEDISVEFNMSKDEDIKDVINKLTDEMLKFAADMEFEKAAEIRDKIKELENLKM